MLGKHSSCVLSCSLDFRCLRQGLAKLFRLLLSHAVVQSGLELVSLSLQSNWEEEPVPRDLAPLISLTLHPYMPACCSLSPRHSFARSLKSPPLKSSTKKSNNSSCCTGLLRTLRSKVLGKKWVCTKHGFTFFLSFLHKRKNSYPCNADIDLCIRNNTEMI